MKTIEEIVSAFEGLLPANDRRWNVASLFPERLHISRSTNGQYAVFLEGESESFGKLPTIGGIEHSSSVTALPTARTFQALRLTSRDAVHGNRVMSHIAYELARRLHESPTLSNEELFRQVEWVLLLLGAGDALLTPERQSGLVGECIFLRRLIILGRKLQLSPATALARWWGHDTARRDFAAQGLAVEVKTTSQNSRQHVIGSIEQLDPQLPSEKVFIYSLGIKLDASSERKLPHFIADVESQLISEQGAPDESALEFFGKQLASYGYRREHLGAYLGGPGYLKPHLQGQLFDEINLQRVRYDSFIGGKLPAMVRSVSYVLDIACEPLEETEADALCVKLLFSAPVTYQ